MSSLPQFGQIVDALKPLFWVGAVLGVILAGIKKPLDGIRSLTEAIKDLLEFLRRVSHKNSLIFLELTDQQKRKYGDSGAKVTRQELEKEFTKWLPVLICALALSYAVALAHTHPDAALVPDLAQAAATVCLNALELLAFLASVLLVVRSMPPAQRWGRANFAMS
jgi:hypothetical protein